MTLSNIVEACVHAQNSRLRDLPNDRNKIHRNGTEKTTPSLRDVLIALDVLCITPTAVLRCTSRSAVDHPVTKISLSREPGTVIRENPLCIFPMLSVSFAPSHQTPAY